MDRALGAFVARPTSVQVARGPKYAAKRGQFELMQRLLQLSKLGLNWAPASGWRALHHAAETRRRDVVEWLMVDMGAADAPLPATDGGHPGKTAVQILVAAEAAAAGGGAGQQTPHKYAGVVLVTSRPQHGLCLALFHNKHRDSYEFPWGTWEADKHPDLMATAIEELQEETAGLVMVTREALATAPTLHPVNAVGAWDRDRNLSRIWGVQVDFPQGKGRSRHEKNLQAIRMLRKQGTPGMKCWDEMDKMRYVPLASFQAGMAAHRDDGHLVCRTVDGEVIRMTRFQSGWSQNVLSIAMEAAERGPIPTAVVANPTLPSGVQLTGVESISAWGHATPCVPLLGVAPKVVAFDFDGVISPIDSQSSDANSHRKRRVTATGAVEFGCTDHTATYVLSEGFLAAATHFHSMGSVLAIVTNNSEESVRFVLRNVVPEQQRRLQGLLEANFRFLLGHTFAHSPPGLPGGGEGVYKNAKLRVLHHAAKAVKRPEPVNFCDVLLIDDTYENCAAWTLAGGMTTWVRDFRLGLDDLDGSAGRFVEPGWSVPVQFFQDRAAKDQGDSAGLDWDAWAAVIRPVKTWG